MARGSHKTWGAADKRYCEVCRRKLTLEDASMTGRDVRGERFTLCREHIACYGRVFAGHTKAKEVAQ